MTQSALLHTATASDADHVRVDGVSRSFPGRRVLTDVSFSVSSGEVAALIGENGSGKSTLLRILAEATAAVRALAELVATEGQAMAEGDPGAAARLPAAIEAAERHHAWELDHRVDQVVAGLGLTALPRHRCGRELSGGQVSRLSLAWLLLRSPDTLLLDEPTNHLDDAATSMLADLLSRWSGPVLLASHDRAFLQHREDERGRWVHRFREEQAELTRLRQKVRDEHTVGHPSRGPRTEARAARKFYADRNAKVVARRVNDARTALERLEQDQVRKPPARMRFVGLGATANERPAAASAGPVLTATGLAVTDRLAATSLVVGARTRLLVTGANGSGKSTLLSVLAGVLQPDAGAITRPARLRVALLGQEPLRRDTSRTVRTAYAEAVGPDRAARAPLATFGLIAGRDTDRPMGSLSVGQRRRLDLAVLLADPPDVLLLDEPTNHLSLLLVTELEQSLPDYPGAVVVASHDRWLRAGWSGERLHLEGLPCT